MSLKFIFIAVVICILVFLVIKKLFKMLLWVVVIVACIFAYLVFSGKADFKNLLNKTSDVVGSKIK